MFSYTMRLLFCLPFLAIILITATSAMQLPTPPRASDSKDSDEPLKSERTPEIIERIYLDEVRKSRITKKSDEGEKKDNSDEPKDSEKSDNEEKPDNQKIVKNEDDEENEEEMEPYICRRTARLQRVPMCVRLFDQPHYRDELKIKFNYLAHRNDQPECTKHELTFRTDSLSVHTGIQQEMLRCSGRHHPLRTNWKIDDYREVFYVSTGVVPLQPAAADRVVAPDGAEPEPRQFSQEMEPAQADSDAALEGTDAAHRESGYFSDSEETEIAPGSAAPTSGKTKSNTNRPVPDSLVVYKRERDADTERFVVYDIIENFKPKTLTVAVVTEYDVEEDLHSMSAISFNNNVAELEVIYIREMFKPLNPNIPFLGPEDRLSQRDGLAHYYESDLVILCWVILDQPQYKAIDFQPQPPPPRMNKNAVAARKQAVNFQHSVDYNKESIKQPMYACKPRTRRKSAPGRATAPERIQISSGARPNSYFVYTLHEDGNPAAYNIFELVENLPMEPQAHPEESMEVPRDLEEPIDVPTQRRTEFLESKFIQIVHKRNVNKDIVCKKLDTDQIRTVCLRLFRRQRYAKEVKIFYNYRLSTERLDSCNERKVTIVSAALRSTAEYNHPMGVCEGRHEILRTGYAVDDYKDLFHISQGPDENSVMVFLRNKTADSEWYQVHDIVRMNNLENVRRVRVTPHHIQAEYNRSLETSYNSDGPEIEVIYIREMLKMAPVADTLTAQSKGKMIALCYELLDRDPFKASDFEISRPALYSLGTRVRTYRLAFAHSVEYDNQRPTQPMYPCYGRHKNPQVGWRKDEYLHLYKISWGPRPNSYFLYSLLSTENTERTYTVLEFVENAKEMKKLKPEKIEYKDVYLDLMYGNSESFGARRKTDHPEQTDHGKPKRDKVKYEKPVNTKIRPTASKPAEPEKQLLRNQKPAQIHQNKTPTVKSTPTKSGRPPKVPVENAKTIKTQQEPSEEFKRVFAELSKILQDIDKPKVDTENSEPKGETENPGPNVEMGNSESKVETENSGPKVEMGNSEPEIVMKNSEPKVGLENSEPITNPVKPKIEIENTEPTTINLGKATGVMNPVKERKASTKPDSILAAIQRLKPITPKQEEVPEIQKQVIPEELVSFSKVEEPTEIKVENSAPITAPAKPKIENTEPIAIDSGKITKVMNTAEESRVSTKPDSILTAIQRLKPINPKQEVSKVLNQEIPEEITPLKAEEPTEINIGNSDPAELKGTPGPLEQVSTKGRKKWIIPEDSIKAVEKSKFAKGDQVLKQEIPEELVTLPKAEKPTDINTENSEPTERNGTPEMFDLPSGKSRKNWNMSEKSMKKAEEKPRFGRSKQDVRAPFNSSERLTRLNSRPRKSETGKPQSMKNELEEAHERFRLRNSKNKVSPPIAAEPMQNDINLNQLKLVEGY